MSRLIYLLFSFEGRIGRLSFFLGGLAQLFLTVVLWIYPIVVLASLEKGARPPAGRPDHDLDHTDDPRRNVDGAGADFQALP